jgi:hypothetical protein
MARRDRPIRYLCCALAGAALLGAAAGPSAAADPVALLGDTAPEEVALDGGARLLVWRLADRAGAGRPLEVVVVVIPGGAATWRVLPVDAAGSRTALLDDLPCPGAIARASGGFFAAHQGGHAPLGLAVGDGVALSPFSPRRWGGVLVRRGGESAILPLAAFPADGVWDQALQSSPILVADGANDMLRDDGQLDNRLAVALDGAGGLALVGAFRDGGGAVSLHSFAELLLALGLLAGLAPESALALDGGSSAGIVLPGADRSWGSSLPGYMPNALCLAPPGP